MVRSLLLVPLLGLVLAVPALADNPKPPKTYVWRARDNGTWSTDRNWDPVGIPGPGDTVLFSGQISQSSATMDLGNGGFYHIGKLRIDPDYTGTIELKSALWVDVLVMKNGTISGPKPLNISQRTGSWVSTTIFETSFWHGGTIATDLKLWGDPHHTADFDIQEGKVVPRLEGNFTIQDQMCRVRWEAGNFEIAPGKTITNKGDFYAFSEGIIGNDGNAQQKWNFINMGRLARATKARFNNANESNKGPGQVAREVPNGNTQ
jgi:hypothetical protein